MPPGSREEVVEGGRAGRVEKRQAKKGVLRPTRSRRTLWLPTAESVQASAPLPGVGRCQIDRGIDANLDRQDGDGAEVENGHRKRICEEKKQARHGQDMIAARGVCGQAMD